MKRNRSLHDKMIERNWVLKRKRKRLPSGSELSNGKDGISTLPLESPANSASSKQRLKDDFSISQSTHKKKGNDGHYYECVICDLGGNLLCCDSCPRTYHLQCLNPPLKRTPHGKWHCPNCCEQKDSVISSTPIETVSKRARTNITTEKSKSGVKASGSRKLSLIVRASSLGKKRSSSSSKEKCAFTCISPPLEKKSVSDQMNISSGTKSTSLSSDDASAKPPSVISNKETQTSSRSMDSEPEAEIGSPLKKLILHLHRPGQKPRKNGEKVNKADHQKRKSKTDNGKSVGVTLGEDGSKVSSACTGMKNRRKRTSVDRQKSKEGPGMRKLVVQECTKKPFERKIKSSNEKDEVDGKTDKVMTCEENILEAVQQVDRILGCRVQSYVANKQSTKLASDDRAVNVENARNLPGAEFDISTSHVWGEEVTEKETGVNKMDVEGISITEECCKKADLLASTSVPVKDQSPTAIKSETHTHEEPALTTVDIMDVPIRAGTTMAEESRDANDASLEARPNRTTETNFVKMGPTQTEKVVYEFLIKWVGRSHIHNTWVDESLLKVLAKRKLENYKAKYGTTVINICQEQWEQPQRVIALRDSKEGIKEALVKWCGLPYDECTWERLDQPIIEEHFHLISEFEQFESQTRVKDSLEDDSFASKGDQMEIFPLTEQPKELRGSLFPHQLEALNWLRKCWYRSKNVILADEMGLGKTVSAAAFMSSLYLEFKVKLPCLVLVPLSTMPNWVAEFVSWAPHLNVVEYHGSAKARSIIRQHEWHASNLSGPQKSKTTSYKFHVLLTTYEMVLADSNHLRGVPWAVLIVDEGHRLKNSSSKLFSLLNTFSFQHRVLLTGTPLQNNLGEMYNLLNFLQPASFPSLSCFEEKFNDLTTAEKVEELKKLVAPHMLRRLKKDAMQNIPPKTERMVPVELTSIQAEYYRAMLTKNYQVLRNIGKGAAQQSMLNIVMQLRKVCNHPYLIPGTEPESGSIEFLHEMRIKASAKLTLLHSMLKIMNKEGHRVLIFSQMTKLLDILEDYLTVEFGPKTFERVDGSVSVGDRQAAIARFNQDQSRFVFLLSTRSCGLGINLATADTVIIYDSDFNPHADIQAMNRAHRIGQSKRLLVYRLVVRASVEERILQLAKKKLMLDQLFVNKSGSQKEVEDILRWGTEELFSYLSSDRDGKNATNGTSKSIPEVGEETEQKHRRRGGGGLGDVYQDKCTDGAQRIIWDETAILRLLDRSNLDYGSTESAEADLDHDMLGSVKSLEWNDEQTEDQGATETLPGIAVDVEQTSAKKEDPVINVTEENEWDRLLRVRWEKYQNEEEASLGRGKRLRKAVSYKEVFAAHPSDALSESGNEEDEPGPEPEREVEYTPAGRALKEKYAKLRARQKERLAQRHLAEASCPVETNLAGPESVPQFHSTEGDASHIKSIGAVMDRAPQINLEDEKSSQASETIATYKNAPPSRNKGTPHVYKTIQSPHLDSSLKPPDNVSPNIFLPAHQFQNTSFGGNSMPSTIRGPILGLCAPNAHLRDSAPKTFQSYLHPQRSSSQPNESGLRIPEFPPPLAPCASTSINIGSGPESMADISALPDTSEVLHHLKSTMQEGRFSYQPCPPSTSRGRGPIDPLDVSGNRFSSFQDKMVASNLFLDQMLLPKVQFHHKNASNSSPDLLPSLSLNMKGETMTHSIQEFPIMPLLPNFRFPFSENPKQNHHNLKEPRPVLGLGQMQPTYPSLPENHKKVLDNILMRTGAGSSKLKKRLKTEASWSEEELDTLWIGVRRHGRGNWDSMLIDPKLKFSKYRTPENLSERWEQEQLKILDGLAFPVPKSGKSTSFPCLSDGMMTRALFGSRFAGVGVPEQYGPPKFQSHLTDIQLGYGDLASSFSQLERTDHFGQMNEHLPPMPGWKLDKFRSSNSVASHAGPSDRPGNSTLPLEAPHLPNSLTDNLLQKDELCASKYLKLPTLLDRSLNWLRDSQNNKQSAESKPMFLPDLGKKPSSGHSPITENPSGGSSSVNKLPHWLREAVSVPSKPPEPKLPPTVSAIAQSVRLLYGEERPTIPPFTVPGPLPFRPKDPRKSLKKKKLRKLGRVTPEVCTASSIPQAPPFPMMPSSTASSLGLPCVEPKLSLPSLNLNILNASSSASTPSNGKKSGLTLLPSPEVLHLVSSCVAPSPHLPSTSFVPDAPEMKTGFEQFELPGKIKSLDTVKGARGKRKARSSPLGSWGKFVEDPVADSTVSGDSSKTHSESCAVRPEVEELSSEETVSDDQQSEPE